MIIGTVDENGHYFKVINEVGELIDSCPVLLPGRELSEPYKTRNPQDPLWNHWPVAQDDLFQKNLSLSLSKIP